MPTLVFIDTNIFLDFYRLPGREALDHQLDYIDQAKDRIIISNQVEMEFKKARQVVLRNLLKKNFSSIQSLPDIPLVLASARSASAMTTAHKTYVKHHKNVQKRIVKLLADPKIDPVLKGLKKVFGHKSPLNLTQNDPLRHQIQRRAWRRWILGYPPRKPQDNSIGDAINWEWVLHCANTNPGHSIEIVSRDGDFGAIHSGQAHLNDWLAQEFKERVGRNRTISLTSQLTEALKALGIRVTKKSKQDELEAIASAREQDFAFPIQPTLSSSVFLPSSTSPFGRTTTHVSSESGLKGFLDTDD